MSWKKGKRNTSYPIDIDTPRYPRALHTQKVGIECPWGSNKTLEEFANYDPEIIARLKADIEVLRQKRT